MNRKQKIIVSITGIILVSLILIGLTYAYFLTKITGNTNSKSISVTTANLELVYGDGNGILAPTDKLMPGDTVGTKEFTVTNNGNNKVEGYLVIFRNVTNTLLRPEDLVYKVECKQYLNDVETGTCDGVEYETQLPTGTGSGSGVIVSNDIEAGYVQKYKLTLDYLNPDVDQSDDMNKTIEAKIDIMDVKLLNSKNGITNYASDTLAGTIINNAMLAKSSDEENGVAVLRGKPITIPGIESSTQRYYELDAGTDKSVAATTTNYYTYGDSYEFDELEGKVKIYNKDGSTLKAVQYNTGYEELKGKYLVQLAGSSDSVPLESKFNRFGSSRYGVNKVLDTTDSTTIYYNSLNMVSKYRNLENTLSVTSDDEGISYYYRGNVKNNYIEFDDKCWRIVRIEGDGSVKLILSAQKSCNLITDEDTKSAFITQNFSDISNQNFQLIAPSTDENNLFSYDHYTNVKKGYQPLKNVINTFGNGGTLKYFEGEEHETTVNYNGFGEENKNFLKSDQMCLSSNDNKYIINKEEIYNSRIAFEYYALEGYINNTGYRLFVKKSFSFNCEKKSEPTDYYILSTDEALYAGYAVGKSSGSFISSTNYLSDNAYFDYYLSNDLGPTLKMTCVENYEADLYTDTAKIVMCDEEYSNVRPMVTIKNNTTVTGGNGTKNNPYIIN